jgi:type I restriction enzyme S subunit
MDLTDGGRRPKRGDIIYTRNASIGIASFVETDQPFCMGQDVCLITSYSQDQRFLTYCLNTFGADQLELAKIGSTFTRVNVRQIVELRVPAPDVEEQRCIADQLDKMQATTDAITERLDCQTVLLRERRQALITAAVTGKIEVARAKGGVV